MLGYFISTGLLTFIFSPIIFKLIALLTLLISYIFLRRSRKSKKYDLCENCSELVPTKVCEGYKYMLEKEKEFSKEVSGYFNNKKFHIKQ